MKVKGRRKERRREGGMEGGREVKRVGQIYFANLVVPSGPAPASNGNPCQSHKYFTSASDLPGQSEAGGRRAVLWREVRQV